MQRFTRDLARVVGLALLVGASLGGAPAQAAPLTYLAVDSLGNNCLTSQPTPYTDLQSALTVAAATGIHTIRICPGTYAQETLIDQMTSLTVSAAFPDQPPVLAPAAGQLGGWILSVNNSNGIVLDHLILNGSLFDGSSSNPMFGLMLRNSNVIVQNTAVEHVRQVSTNAQISPAVYVVDNDNNGKTSTVTLKHDYITDVQQAGLFVRGQVRLTLLNSYIDANGGASSDTSTGIIITGDTSQQPTATISKNVITATADKSIQLIEVGKVSITGNMLHGSHYGVMIQSQCQYFQFANANKISGNTFDGFDEGVFLYANAFDTGPTPSLCAGHIDGTSITSNTFLAGTPGLGDAVLVNALQTSGSYLPQVTGTVATKNQITGFNSDISETTSGGTTITFKSTAGNVLLP